jgi:diaminopimelate decarboxylase
VDTDDRDALADLLRPADAVTPVGLHTYFATNVEEPDAVAKEFEQAIDTVADVSRAAAHTPRVLDLGGGFAAPMARSGHLQRHRQVARTVEKALARHWPTATRPTLMFESGRYLVGAAGWLLTRVLDVKRVRGRRYAVLDAGTHVLGGMSGLGRLLSPKAEPTLTGSSGVAGARTALVGPLCTPLDVLHPDVALPDEVGVGALLTIPNVGAYGLTASLLGFLSHPIAVEVVHDAGEVVSARRLVIDAVDLLSKEYDHA